jgi:hypothetical protein
VHWVVQLLPPQDTAPLHEPLSPLGMVAVHCPWPFRATVYCPPTLLFLYCVFGVYDAAVGWFAQK